ncbi:ubiquitin-domain-containing protein [Pluteus cervinus]|uniref:Ubiquitin-domain-containing protein n=1 Tax=Pluteus cervinus TaxID=181527 RepID=A0ACD3AWE6_9AGAR|nr:ubiquitin-domain-containing protein [Pluteus cervinus]
MASRTRHTVSLEIKFPAASCKSKSGVLRSENFPYPFDERDLTRFAKKAGYTEPATFSQLRERYCIKVTDGESQCQIGQDGLINIDQPLLHYYHKTFLPVSDRHRGIRNRDSNERSSIANLCKNNKFIDMGGMRVSLRRTIRVPDNGKEHLLPPNMGAFKLYNVADYADKLPKSVVSKGGLFMAIYQREALWIHFVSTKSSASHAVKVSIGDVNALTGLPRDRPTPQGKQDYAAVKNHGGQIWLVRLTLFALMGGDIKSGTRTGFPLRQVLSVDGSESVAMPLGKGYTVEGQVTGKEDVGGLQLDVFDEYPNTVQFNREDNRAALPVYMTPRKLGLTSGSVIYMEDLNQPVKLQLSTRNWPRTLGTQVRILAKHKVLGAMIYAKTFTGKTIELPYKASSTIDELKETIQAIEGIPVDQQCLIFGGRLLQGEQSFSDYNLEAGSTFYLVMCLRGGGPYLLDQDQSSETIVGFAAGGWITQKIIRDSLPPQAYNFSGGRRLHISVINAAHFSSITGLPAPPTPVSTQTYLDSGLPWFKLYEENAPNANNPSIGAALAGVKSVAMIDRERTGAGQATSAQQGCGYCTYEMATLRLIPCGHVVCDDCTDGLSVNRCPACPKHVTSRQRFAAPMRLPGQEDGDGLDSFSMDERIVALKRVAGTNEIVSFKLREHDVSELCGEI